jgi:hypothetical protein
LQTITVAPVTLRINLNETNVVISWPSNVTMLQSAFALGLTSVWSPMTDSIVFANGINCLIVPITNKTRYFRLAH